MAFDEKVFLLQFKFWINIDARIFLLLILRRNIYWRNFHKNPFSMHASLLILPNVDDACHIDDDGGEKFLWIGIFLSV